MQGLVAIEGPIYYFPSSLSDSHFRDLLDIQLLWNSSIDAMVSDQTPLIVRQKINQTMKGAPIWLIRRLLTSFYAKETTRNDKIDIPVLFILGDIRLQRRGLTLEQLEDKIRSVAPHSSVILLIGGVGHFPMGEKPGLVNRILLEFLGGLF